MITKEQVIEKVKELCKLYPENIHTPNRRDSTKDPLFKGENSHYPSCGCLVGVALIDLGYCGPIDDDCYYHSNTIKMVYRSIPLFNIMCKNDRGLKWGEILEEI